MTNSYFGCWELVAIMETPKQPNCTADRGTAKERLAGSSRLQANIYLSQILFVCSLQFVRDRCILCFFFISDGMLHIKNVHQNVLANMFELLMPPLVW